MADIDQDAARWNEAALQRQKLRDAWWRNGLAFWRIAWAVAVGILLAGVIQFAARFIFEAVTRN